MVQWWKHRKCLTVGRKWKLMDGYTWNIWWENWSVWKTCLVIWRKSVWWWLCCGCVVDLTCRRGGFLHPAPTGTSVHWHCTTAGATAHRYQCTVLPVLMHTPSPAAYSPPPPLPVDQGQPAGALCLADHQNNLNPKHLESSLLWNTSKSCAQNQRSRKVLGLKSEERGDRRRRNGNFGCTDCLYDRARPRHLAGR